LLNFFLLFCSISQARCVTIYHLLKIIKLRWLILKLITPPYALSKSLTLYIHNTISLNHGILLLRTCNSRKMMSFVFCLTTRPPNSLSRRFKSPPNEHIMDSTYCILSIMLQVYVVYFETWLLDLEIVNQMVLIVNNCIFVLSCY
jgi:hypothetical protein